ncbi:MAG TPA: dihydrofolate reductase [Gemmataceae bacterium]|jgi:dihydrofolate reductase|nr:dihydrofolate reductase [Gemmataceae bacterium]
MIVSFLVAVDRNLLIGNQTGIPWHLPADLKRFRKLSLGKPIVMGRTTFEHIGRPLDKRVNIVLTRTADYRPDGVLVAHSIEEALRLAGDAPEVMVIGGAEVYRSALPFVTRLHITYVDGAFDGMAWFPATVPTPAGFEWRETHREAHPADQKNAFGHQYVVIERVAVAGAPAGDFTISASGAA